MTPVTLPPHAVNIVVHVVQEGGATQLALSIAAIAISVVAATLSFVLWHLEGRRVAVDPQSAILVSDSERRSGLMLSATNNGRIPAVIKRWGFDNPREVYSLTPREGVWSCGPPTDFTLQPGTSQVWWLDYREQKNYLEREHPGSSFLLRGFVVLGTRRLRLSKVLIDLTTGTTIPVSRIRRRLDRLRNRRGIHVQFVPGEIKPGAQLESVGLRYFFTKIKVDVVQDEVGEQPARALGDSFSVHRFWGRRTIEIEVPDYFLNLPAAKYRVRWCAAKRPHESRYEIPSYGR
jgi:hypothetical protein